MTASTHILDHPVWNTLTSRHAKFSIGGDHARRFVPEIGPLAAARDDSAESLAALAELVPVDGNLILLQAHPIVLPPGIVAVSRSFGVQMVAEELEPSQPDERIVRLTESDAVEMLALATLSKPGPFALRTQSLGEFWGIKQHGVLVAMAGERMKQPGFTEISGICSHPDARGQGLGRALSAAAAARVLARGETPFLHANAGNAVAIRLYGSIGFRLRRQMHVAVLARTGIHRTSPNSLIP
ncbi:MAG: GNAT family N-acetyltransferase [Bdellovibrionota bacterium]